MTTTDLTAETISDRHIRILREEALAAGDYDQAAICDLALDGSIDVDDYTTLSPATSQALRSMTQEASWARCAAAINNARAQEDR